MKKSHSKPSSRSRHGGPKQGRGKSFAPAGRGTDRNRDRDSDRPSGRGPERPQRGDRFERPGPKKFQKPHERDHGKGHGQGRGRAARHEEAYGGGGRAAGILRLKATVDKNQKGFGFLLFENREYEDAFVPPREASRLFHGDRVEVTIGSRGEVLGLRVLEHRFREAVGRFEPHPQPGPKGRNGWMVYERKRAREEIYLPNVPAEVKAGDWIQVKLTFPERGGSVVGEVVKHFGATLPASADIGMIAAEYNLVEEHPPQAESEARSFTLDLSEIEKGIRTDLRHVPFITIDGETARDFDDAIHVERQKSGYILWVAIADVSSYVKEGTALDKDARSRGTSVYFPERAFHMLPRALSENLCSLRPNEPRLAFTAKIHFDHAGKPGKTELIESLIESRRRATYNEIQREWVANEGNPQWEFKPHFELYRLIRKNRSTRGSIDFDLPEAEVRVDAQGEPIAIENRDRLDSHRLIEEFMIAANEAVTEWALHRTWPFIYRVHEDPSEEALQRFQRLASNAGIKLRLDKAGKGAELGQLLSEVVTRLEGHPAQTMLNMQLLRSMRQAVYSAVHAGHFGLASRAYTHFTSPIRRYPDLVVHRQLREALRAEKKHIRKHTKEEIAQMEKDLDAIAEHCSYRERVASEADREAIKLKQVRMALKHLGAEFEGRILGMIESGFFVQIENPWVEGLVSRDSLNDDFYEFDDERMQFRGRRKKRTFKIGDRVRIRVLRADLEKRLIDFGLAEFSGTDEDDEEESLARD